MSKVNPKTDSFALDDVGWVKLKVDLANENGERFDAWKGQLNDIPGLRDLDVMELSEREYSALVNHAQGRISIEELRAVLEPAIERQRGGNTAK